MYDRPKMKKIILLLPVYNDWESLFKVLNEINSVIKDIQEYQFNCIIVNDSSTIEKPKITKPKNFNSLKIIDMKENGFQQVGMGIAIYNKFKI